MAPRHAKAQGLARQRLDAQRRKLVVLDEGHDEGCAPGPDVLEINAQILLPVPTQAIDLLLAGAQGHADQLPAGASLNGVDTQGWDLLVRSGRGTGIVWSSKLQPTHDEARLRHPLSHRVQPGAEVP